MKKITHPLAILLSVMLITISTASEARSFSSRGFGSSSLLKRPTHPKPAATSNTSPANPAPAATQSPALASGQKGIPGAEHYRQLSQQAPSQRLKTAINRRASSGAQLTQLAMLYWLLSSSNTHASELTDSDRAWVQKEIKEHEKNGGKPAETPPSTAAEKP